MSEKILKIRPYPMPYAASDDEFRDENFVPNAQSRFAIAVETTIVDGKTTYKDLIRSAKIPYTPSQFAYEKGEPVFKQELKYGKPIEKVETLPPYIPNEGLAELVRLAQILQRPILLKGEPGSGKTQLAKAVAYEWYGKKYREHYFEWHVKSVSKATDGLYVFDHLRRLRDAQMKREVDTKEYRSFGALGKAILTSTAATPSILLIDEIDKADIDFPNDLLLELDEKRFSILDTEETFEAHHAPVIFITSNDERELPEAFLRRCLFMYISFPDPKQMLEIVRAHVPDLVEKQLKFVEDAMERFRTLQGELKDNADNKRVSTSELLDWLKAYNHDLDSLKPEDLKKESLTNLPRYYQALLKTYAGYKRRLDNITSSTKPKS